MATVAVAAATPAVAPAVPPVSQGSTDTTAPTVPSGLALGGSTADSVSFAWQDSSDSMGVVAYEIWRDGLRIQLTPSRNTTFTDAALGAGASYTYTVRAMDAAGNASPFSVQLFVRTQAAGAPVDRVAPGAPSALTLTLSKPSSLAIAWAPSTDNVGVVRYDIYLGTALVGSTA